MTAWTKIKARYLSTCPSCGEQTLPGDYVYWKSGQKVRHLGCLPAEERPTATKTGTKPRAKGPNHLPFKERDRYEGEYEDIKEEKLYAPLRRGELTPDAYVAWKRARHELGERWFARGDAFDEAKARSEYKEMYRYWLDKCGDRSDDEKRSWHKHRREWTGEFELSALEAQEDRALIRIRADESGRTGPA